MHTYMHTNVHSINTCIRTHGLPSIKDIAKKEKGHVIIVPQAKNIIQ